MAGVRGLARQPSTWSSDLRQSAHNNWQFMARADFSGVLICMISSSSLRQLIFSFGIQVQHA